jgi:hypothetical protein
MHLMKDPDKVIDQLHEIMAVFLVPKKKAWRGWKKQPYNAEKHKEVAEAMLTSTDDNCTTFVRFFFEQLSNVRKTYTGIFGEESREDKETSGARVETFDTKYGWLNVVNNLSNNDATKWGYFFALPLREFLNLISVFRKQSSPTSITNRSKMAFDKLIDALNDFQGAIRQGINELTNGEEPYFFG